MCSMAAFQLFDAEYYSVDPTKQIICKKQSGSATAYTRIPIRIGNGRRGVHQFDLKFIQSGGFGSSGSIGIDQGINNINNDLSMARTNHYVLGTDDGRFYQKGISQRLFGFELWWYKFDH